MTPQAMDATTRAAVDSSTPHVAVFDIKAPVMSNPIHPSVFLRGVVFADAFGTTAMAAAMLLAIAGRSARPSPGYSCSRRWRSPNRSSSAGESPALSLPRETDDPPVRHRTPAL